MTAEELNKGKELVVKLLNAVFSSQGDYKIEYRTDETGIIANLVNPDNALPIVNKWLVNEQVYTSFKKASKYLPQAMDIYSDVDIIVEYNGETLTDNLNETIVSQSILDCFNSTIEYIQNNNTLLNTLFLNVGSAMGDYKVTLVNNTILKSQTYSNTHDISFLIYVLPDYILLTNKEGQSVKVTPEDIKEFVTNGGEDGEPYHSTEEEIIDSILSSTSFAITEQDESGTIIPEFYNCIQQYFDWGSDFYEDYYPKLEILVNGISNATKTYGHYKETNLSDFERVDDLFTFLNNKK